MSECKFAVEAFHAYIESIGLHGSCGTLGELKAFKAGAEWQRSQQGAPAGWPTDDMVVRGAEELHDSLRMFGIDINFDTKTKGTEIQQEIVEAVFNAMLAAALQPIDYYQFREDTENFEQAMTVQLEAQASSISALQAEIVSLTVRLENSDAVISSIRRSTGGEVMSALEEWEADEMLRNERYLFEGWLIDEQGLPATWDRQRNCYSEFPAHLAWKAWCAAKMKAQQEVKP